MSTPQDLQAVRERAMVLRKALEQNPSNKDIGDNPSYIDEETLRAMEEAQQLSADEVKAIKSQPRK
jgi:hypothetical protein